MSRGASAGAPEAVSSGHWQPLRVASQRFVSMGIEHVLCWRGLLKSFKSSDGRETTACVWQGCGTCTADLCLHLLLSDLTGREG